MSASGGRTNGVLEAFALGVLAREMGGDIEVDFEEGGPAALAAVARFVVCLFLEDRLFLM